MNTRLQYLFGLVFIFSIWSCGNDAPLSSCPDDSAAISHLELGNPSNATNDVNNPNNFLISLPQYALSYSRDRGIPNWVSWRVDRDWFGNAFRQDDFRAYDAFPSDWYTPDESSYLDSGFDRGHCCPSADRLCSSETNSSTFYMTNMVPQAPNHNRGLWRVLEEYTRLLAEQGNEVYVITGNYGAGGLGNMGYKETIDNGNIVVPLYLYKIILAIPRGNDDAQRVNENSRLIAVNIQNTNLADDYKWWEFRTTVDFLEEATGYDFLSSVPASIQNIIEARLDDGPVE